MENKVIMSLNDYNALKRKADAFDNAITVNAYGTWVDCNINPCAVGINGNCILKSIRFSLQCIIVIQ